MKRILLIAVMAAAVCAAIPGASSAAGPTLRGVSFDQATKVLSVTWSLPPGVQSSVLEANTNPALDSEGYFLYGPHDGNYGSNTIFEVPDSSATSWLHRYPDLPPGHYYVHVGGFDSTCNSCPLTEWTTLGTFSVTLPPPKVFAPDCSGRPHFRPRSIIVACGDGNLSLLSLRWSTWTPRVATGVGVYHWNDCKPACYLGHFHSRAGARVKLYRVTRCRSKGFLQFTRKVAKLTRRPSGPVGAELLRRRRRSVTRRREGWALSGKRPFAERSRGAAARAESAYSPGRRFLRSSWERAEGRK